jgi:hypothetical protein
MMNAKDIASAIVSSNLSNDDLNLIVDAVKLMRANIGRKNKYVMDVGDMVKWKSTRTGTMVTGKIEKIATKYITVNAGPAGRWRVAANMLSEV